MRSWAKLSGAAFAAALAAGLATGAHASDGTVTITGEVTAQTCKINGGTPSFTVSLPKVSTTALAAANATAGRTPFQIALTECNPATGTVSAYFEPGANTDTDNNRLKNTGTATNVAVQLLNSSSTAIALGKDATGQGGGNATLAGGAATLKYFAEYLATTGAAGAGTVSTSTTYSIVYQ